MITMWKEFRKWRLYRRTLSELSALSDGDLKDLGLYRGDLRRVCYYAAYGNGE